MAKDVCIAGKNNISVEVLDFLIKNFPENRYYVIISKTDNGKDSSQLSLKKYAETHLIKIVKLEEMYSITNLVFLSLEFDRIIIPNNFNSNKLFNIHFSLLPAYKGMYTSVTPIL
jgi:methionyl-tRNA formyltransferase